MNTKILVAIVIVIIIVVLFVVLRKNNTSKAATLPAASIVTLPAAAAANTAAANTAKTQSIGMNLYNNAVRYYNALTDKTDKDIPNMKLCLSNLALIQETDFDKDQQGAYLYCTQNYSQENNSTIVTTGNALDTPLGCQACNPGCTPGTCLWACPNGFSSYTISDATKVAKTANLDPTALTPLTKKSPEFQIFGLTDPAEPVIIADYTMSDATGNHYIINGETYYYKEPFDGNTSCPSVLPPTKKTPKGCMLCGGDTCAPGKCIWACANGMGVASNQGYYAADRPVYVTDTHIYDGMYNDYFVENGVTYWYSADYPSPYHCKDLDFTMPSYDDIYKAAYSNAAYQFSPCNDPSYFKQIAAKLAAMSPSDYKNALQNDTDITQCYPSSKFWPQPKSFTPP